MFRPITTSGATGRAKLAVIVLGLVSRASMGCALEGPDEYEIPDEPSSQSTNLLSNSEDSQAAERFSGLASAYRDRRGWEFTQQLQEELRDVRHSDAETCVVRQRALIAAGESRGFDGLEALALAHHDCLLSTDNPEEQKMALVILDELARSIWFADAPIPNLSQRVARRDTLVERGVEGAAVRTVLEQLVNGGHEFGLMPLGTLLQVPKVQRSLCELPLRAGSGSIPSGASVARIAMCEALGTPGGRGALDDLCAPDAEGAAAYERIGMKDALAVPEGTGGEESRSAYELAASTCAGGVAFGELAGVDPFDAFSSEECIGGTPTDQAAAVDVAQLVRECFSTDDDGPWDPAAGDDDGTEPSPEPPPEEPDPAPEPAPEPSDPGSGAAQGSPEGSVVGEVAGAVGSTASLVELQIVLMAEYVVPKLAGDVVALEIAGAGTAAGAAAAVGAAATIVVMGDAVYNELSSLSEYNRANGHCWPNCHDKNRESGSPKDSFDPQNDSCQTLVELDLLAPGAKIEETDIPDIAIIQPSPEAEEFVSSSPGFCGLSVGMGLDHGARCTADKDCGPFADLREDCSCRPRTETAAAWFAETATCAVMLDCGDMVFHESDQCFCDSGDEEEIEERWGGGGEPDPVAGDEPIEIRMR